ncbi:MAG: hypothetical protein NTY77_06295 [Elusimicrobia bacterium]|nr:hypothetical protein [Elusimicrobiota bacterium]
MIEDATNRAVAIGIRNQEIEKLVSNWCAHASVERSPLGGVGVVEQMTGLPIGMRFVRCQFAVHPSMSSMNLESVALGFYAENCIGCEHRRAVGLSNISILYGKLEDDRKQAEQARAAAMAAAQEATRLRKERRASNRNPKDGMRERIITLIDEIDAGDIVTAGRELGSIAENAPGRFDAPIVDMLFELVDLGGGGVEVGLTTSRRISPSDPRLVPAALKALEKGGARLAAGEIVETSLLPEHCGYLEGAVWGLIELCAPPRVAFLERSVTLYPGPLIKAFETCRVVVIRRLKEFLKEDQKIVRIAACRAIERLLQHDSSIVDEIVPELLASIGLPDDPYDDGSAASHATDALAVAMIREPAKVDAAVYAALSRAQRERAKEIFGVYEAVMRRNLRNKSGMPQAAIERTAKRTLDILLDPESELLGEALDVLHLITEYSPKALQGKEELIVGAAALIIAQSRQPKQSVLTDPNWDPLRGLEAGHRALLQSQAVDGLAKALEAVAVLDPQRVFLELQKMWESIRGKEDTAEIRMVLVAGFVGVGRNVQSLECVLHYLYTAMHDPAVTVRAAAAEAYGEIVDCYGEDLPSLLHETFLLLLTDQYKAVHQGALRALRWKKMPKNIRGRVFDSVFLLCKAYVDAGDDGFLEDALNELDRRARDVGVDESKVAPFLLKTALKMKPTIAIEVIGRRKSGAISQHPLYAELVCRLLKVEEIMDRRDRELVSLVASLPEEKLHALADEIAATSVTAYKTHNGILALELIEVLCAAAEFVAAKGALSEIRAFLPETIEHQAARKELEICLDAVIFEENCQKMESAEAARIAKVWKELVGDAEEDTDE